MPIKSVGSDPVQVYAAPAYGKPGQPFLVGNNSATATVYYSSSPTLGPSSSTIPPLGFAGFDGSRDMWASTLSSAIALVDFVPGGTHWAPNPQITAQLNAAGLAKDSSLATINSTLGIPAQNSTVQGVANAVNALQPTMLSASLLRSGAGTTTVITFPSTSRIWAVHLSFAAATSNTYAAGTITNLFAQLSTGSGLALTVVELIVSGPTQVDNSDSDLVFTSGLAVNGGDTLQLNVNGGTVLSNGAMRASCTALYSTP